MHLLLWKQVSEVKENLAEIMVALALSLMTSRFLRDRGGPDSVEAAILSCVAFIVLLSIRLPTQKSSSQNLPM
jgi:hypothetical protein